MRLKVKDALALVSIRPNSPIRDFALEFTLLPHDLLTMIARILLLCLLLSPGLAFSQEQGLVSRVIEADNISPEVWRTMTAGRTVTYHLNGQLFGTEHYHPNSNRAAFRHADGTCLDGTWAFKDGIFCFYWENHLPACFHHVQDNRGIIVISASEDGGFNFGNVQVVTEITDKPIVCQPEGTS